MHTKRIVLAAALAMLIWTGRSSAYFAYEADVYPEDAGWTLGGDEEEPDVYTRTLENGVYGIDATATGVATVFHWREFQLDDNDLWFEWRARTSNDDGFSYQSLLIDGEGLVSQLGVTWRSSIAFFHFQPDAGKAEFTTFTAPLVPGEFHVFRAETDGDIFSVFLDGAFVGSDVLQDPGGTVLRPQFGFTKDWHRIPTTAEWDYIRAGVVPEPASLLLLLAGTAVIRRGRVI